MDRIWKKGENSQGRFRKLWFEQLGGEDHLLGSEKVSQVYLLRAIDTGPVLVTR